MTKAPPYYELHRKEGLRLSLKKVLLIVCIIQIKYHLHK